MWLRVKVFIGYVSLIFLLIITVGLFRKEQVNRDRLRQEEQKLHLVRGLVEQSYAGLLELSTYGEMVSVWDKEDFNSYHTKRLRLPYSTKLEEVHYRFWRTEQHRLPLLTFTRERGPTRHFNEDI